MHSQGDSWKLFAYARSSRPNSAVIGPMGSASLAILIAGLSTGSYIFGLDIHARRMRLRGRELAGKVATLLDAQPVDPS